MIGGVERSALRGQQRAKSELSADCETRGPAGAAPEETHAVLGGRRGDRVSGGGLGLAGLACSCRGCKTRRENVSVMN